MKRLSKILMMFAVTIAIGATLQGCAVKTLYDLHRCGGSNICR
jgi:hypothetical protein